MEVPYRVEERQSRMVVLAMQDIAKGTLIRKISPGVNTKPIKGQTMFCQYIDSLQYDDEKVEWVHRCYGLNGTFHELIDDSRHMNHGKLGECNISRGQGIH